MEINIKVKLDDMQLAGLIKDWLNANYNKPNMWNATNTGKVIKECFKKRKEYLNNKKPKPQKQKQDDLAF